MRITDARTSPHPKLGITHLTLRTRPVSERWQGRKILEGQACFAFAWANADEHTRACAQAYTEVHKHTHVYINTDAHTPCVLLFRDKIDNFLQKGVRGGGMRKPKPSSSTRQQHDHHHQLHNHHHQLHHHHHKRSRAAPASLQGSGSKGQEHPMRSLMRVLREKRFEHKVQALHA